jgi:hypothetical protein
MSFQNNIIWFDQQDDEEPVSKFFWQHDETPGPCLVTKPSNPGRRVRSKKKPSLPLRTVKVVPGTIAAMLARRGEPSLFDGWALYNGVRRTQPTPVVEHNCAVCGSDLSAARVRRAASVPSVWQTLIEGTSGRNPDAIRPTANYPKLRGCGCGRYHVYGEVTGMDIAPTLEYHCGRKCDLVTRSTQACEDNRLQGKCTNKHGPFFATSNQIIDLLTIRLPSHRTGSP